MSSLSRALSRLRPLWPHFKWGFFALLIVFLGRRAYLLWITAPVEEIRINPTWLILAGIVYCCGWIPSAWFWMTLMRRMNQPAKTWDVFRAYYAGHVGKYVPGKALVLFIRAALLRPSGVDPIMAGVTVGYETLVYMATGMAWALALAPVAFPELFASWTGVTFNLTEVQKWSFGVAVFAMTFLTTPVTAWVFTLLGRKTLKSDLSTSQRPPAISAGLISLGVVVCSVGWACHALCMGLVLKSISPSLFRLSDFPTWLGAFSLSTVGGFLVIVAPGGLGVREAVLIEVLKDQPDVGPANAVIAAGLLRTVTFVSELGAAAIFYLAGKRRS